MGMVDCSGSVKFRGEEMVGRKAYQIAHQGLGYVPENRDIFPTLSVRQNLLLGQKAAKPSARWKMEDMFELFPRLKDRADNEAGVLSGGEQQMLTIARTLMGNPELLLLDEPSEGLAPVIVENLLVQVQRLKREGLTILLAEQGVDFSLSLADRVYVLEKGAIRHSGPAAQLRDDAVLRGKLLAL
jgi:branched-chain amino acid transport system ATP-binding protein